MNINKQILKISLLSIFSLAICIFFQSCNSTKVKEPEPILQEEKAPPVIDDEYQRSTKEVSDVSYEEFQADKKIILQKIEELSVIMADYNYSEWVKYIDGNSISYWSNQSNLIKASKRLPVKGLRLRTLQDYFKYVFVPARKNHEVEEIRYIDKGKIKAVQVKDETDVVYYNFQKINGEWTVVLPELEN